MRKGSMVRLVRAGGVLYVGCRLAEPQMDQLKPTVSQPGRPVEIRDYMVDFKNIYRVDRDVINRGCEAPPGLKILQLTVSARQELRQKLSFYYGRAPEEDEA